MALCRWNPNVTSQLLTSERELLKKKRKRVKRLIVCNYLFPFVHGTTSDTVASLSCHRRRSTVFVLVRMDLDLLQLE